MGTVNLNLCHKWQRLHAWLIVTNASVNYSHNDKAVVLVFTADIKRCVLHHGHRHDVFCINLRRSTRGEKPH